MKCVYKMLASSGILFRMSGYLFQIKMEMQCKIKVSER